MTAFDPLPFRLMMPVVPPAAKLEKVCAAELFQLNVAPEATPSAAEYEPEPREPDPSIVRTPLLTVVAPL